MEVTEKVTVRIDLRVHRENVVVTRKEDKPKI